MDLSENIVDDISIQPISTEIGHLKKMFDELTFSHLPIAENGHFVGCVCENDLRCFESSKTVDDYRYSLLRFFVHDHDNWLDILKAFAENDTNLMPVLDENNKGYLGYIELGDILAQFRNMPFLQENGSVIILKRGVQEFSFSEIGQIVESNNGKVFGAIVSGIEGETAEITLKIGLSGVNEIIQTFRRYGYKIVNTHQEDAFLQNLKERSDYLDKYLNI